MKLHGLLHVLNYLPQGQAVFLVDTLSTQNDCIGDTDWWELWVIDDRSPYQPVRCVIELDSITYTYTCRNFFHMQMEVNSLHLPPYQSGDDDDRCIRILLDNRKVGVEPEEEFPGMEEQFEKMLHELTMGVVLEKFVPWKDASELYWMHMN